MEYFQAGNLRHVKALLLNNSKEYHAHKRVRANI
jgi:hypothetical protein